VAARRRLPVAAGDQDGVRGDELVVVRGTDDGLATASLRGVDAGQRWSAAAGIRR
jgi:hypothetical protein